VGGVPELVHESHQEQVLFECTAESLCKSLLGTLDAGGWVAAPSQTQDEIRHVWGRFHADARRYLRPRAPTGSERRAVAVVDGGSLTGLRETLESLAEADAVRRVVVLNRQGGELPQTACGFSVRNIDLTVEEAGALDAEMAKLEDEAVLLIHSGVRVRADAFAVMLSALEGAGVDGLQPAAEVSGAAARKTVLPLGGDPSFTLFMGATFTGGLLVSGEAFKRARLWRELAFESAFMGLADFCVTRGIKVWPCPLPVFELAEDWKYAAAGLLPARLKAFDECAPSDRYYMLATGYGTSGYCAGAAGQTAGRKLTALALVDLGLLPLVRAASWARRRARSLRQRMQPGGPVERYLGWLLRGNG
ncbi:MAG TPA: hypothetical protein VE713_18055, partial [Pyrinomonadaceae bacterium]|nr:hypothetical protein [Pyrinomonadaceae bacterium]